MIDREFADHLLQCFDDPSKYGVHQLFNTFWRYAPDDVKEKYVADFDHIPEQRQWLADGWFAEPVDFESLAQLPNGTLGRAYYHFILDNNLEKQIANNYRSFHEMLESSGMLNGMPAQIKYAVLRGFQSHDFLHLVAGYPPTPRDEIALQAFCLAQIRFPYFGMWMSVITTRMTFLDPDMINPMMDAITEGWRYGRSVKNIQFARWETMLDRPLDAVRADFGIHPDNRHRLAA